MTAQIVIGRESFSSDIAAEILPLAQKCWEESTIAKAETCAYYGERDFAIEPNVETYQQMADRGLLVLVTIRDEGKLRGYVLGLLYYSPHHKKILCGTGDSVYIEPDYRSYTGVIAERFEEELRGLGVKILGWPVHMNGPVYGVLKARGYVGDDIVMEKRLCV